jgi:hypothetical protein
VDYFNHVRQSPSQNHIYFSEETIRDDSNPWLNERSQSLHSWDAVSPNILFLAGLDWFMLKEMERKQSPVPIINLIQSVRHAQANNECYPFLKHKAIRICVSDQVRAALSETCRKANGPIFVIPNGIDTHLIPDPMDIEKRNTDILIVGLKQSELAQRLYQI